MERENESMTNSIIDSSEKWEVNNEKLKKENAELNRKLAEFNERGRNESNVIEQKTNAL
jgi:hypothetical protein